jgi:hypothetical protein
VVVFAGGVFCFECPFSDFRIRSYAKSPAKVEKKKPAVFLGKWRVRGRKIESRAKVDGLLFTLGLLAAADFVLPFVPFSLGPDQVINIASLQVFLVGRGLSLEGRQQRADVDFWPLLVGSACPR